MTEIEEELMMTKGTGSKRTLSENTVVCVVGAGYVGLPLAKTFAQKFKVISYDIDEEKIKRLSEENNNSNHTYTSDSKEISRADFISICVPTPITRAKYPDMSYVEEAATVVGQNMKKGVVVVLESSVYPGVTEDIVKPILAEESGYKYGMEYQVAYSPERINPGDEEHVIENVTKIIAADNEETLNLIDELYRHVTPHIFRASDIKTAEAAKLVENTQRDLNIALVNELSIIFEKMGLSTNEVLDAAASKWNFQKFSPGLVGGYCIPVVPYFLVHKAEEYGYHPRVILSGRAINDAMPKHVAEIAIKCINDAGKVIKGAKVLIMGCTYKENVEDTRESPVREVIEELRIYGIDVWGYDPVAKEPEASFGMRFVKNITEAPRMDCIILTIAHDVFKTIDLATIKGIMNSPPVLIDLRGMFNRPGTLDNDFIYRCL